MKKKNRKIGPVSKAQQKILNVQFFGNEPEPETKFIDNNLTLIKILNWYSSNIDKSTAYSFLKEYCKNNNLSHLLKDTNEKSFPQGIYSLARLMNRGYTISDEHKSHFDKVLMTPYAKEEVEEIVSVSTTKRTKSNPLIEQIEEILDNNDYEFDVKDYIRNHNIANYKLDECKTYYEPLLYELTHIKQDPQLKEAYRSIPLKIIKARIEFLQNLIDVCTISKKVRVVIRKPKQFDPSKALKTFNFKNRDDVLGITSINPEKIFGAKELWVFDSRYNVLTKLVANDNEALGVRGCTIININENSSISKRIGRNKKLVNDVIISGKVALRQIFNSIKTEPVPLKVRTNNHTILLKVF